MNLKLRNTVFIIFSVLWAVVIWIEYIQKHPLYALAMEKFLYYGLWVGKLVVFAGVAWIIEKKKIPLKFVSGLTLVAFLFFLFWVQMGVYNNQLLNPRNLSANTLQVSIQVFKFLVITSVILLSGYGLGKLFGTFNFIERKDLRSLTILALGLISISGLVFVLGAFSFLHPILIGVLLLGILIFSFRKWGKEIKALLIQPIYIPNKNTFLYILFFLILADFVLLNLAQACTPMPRGFDALTYYANLPRLIGESGGLVGGFPPNNWALIMSLGWILTGGSEVSHLLSFSGGVLAIFACYSIGRNYTKLSPAWVLLSILLWYSIPAFTTQSSNELKVDLALLFFQLIALALMLSWLKMKNLNSNQDRKYILLIGLICGYLIGLKLTAIYFIIPLLLIQWYDKEKPIKFYGAMLFALGLILLAGLDSISGLRAYHMGVEIIGGLLAVGGLVVLISNYIKSKESVLKVIRQQSLIGLLCFLVFIPWIGKNYVDTGKMDFRSLLFGDTPGIELHIDQMDANWRKSQKGGNQ